MALIERLSSGSRIDYIQDVCMYRMPPVTPSCALFEIRFGDRDGREVIENCLVMVEKIVIGDYELMIA